LGLIVDGNLSTPQVANYLTNVTSLGGANQAASLARSYKGIFGTGTPEWSALQESVLNRLTTAEPGRAVTALPTEGGTTPLNPRMMVVNLEKFLNGQGREAAQEMFTPEQLNNLRSFTQAVKNTLPMKEFNPSKSGYTWWRIFSQHLLGPAVGGGGLAFLESRREGASLQSIFERGMTGAVLGYIMNARPMAVMQAIQATQPLAGRAIPPQAAATFGPLITGKYFNRRDGGALNRAVAIARKGRT
jgi:hypothetical protein